jgi:outer membrane protein OmpA-like peptidoglycan-associated protein
MTKYPDVKIRLDGYTDNSGTDKVNEALSVKRAEAAMQYMVSKGIDAGRISAEGHGAANPVAENKQAAGRAQNRRVEITIL